MTPAHLAQVDERRRLGDRRVVLKEAHVERPAARVLQLKREHETWPGSVSARLGTRDNWTLTMRAYTHKARESAATQKRLAIESGTASKLMRQTSW